MADAKISALPTGASVVAGDIIPYVNVLGSVTAAIGIASIFTNTAMNTPSIIGGTLTRMTIANPSITGVANFPALSLSATAASITGASITSLSAPRATLDNPSVTGVLNAGVTVLGGTSITAVDFSLGATAIGGVFVSGAASALGYLSGAGGTVTQSVGGTKEQAVALNRATGKIILSNSVMQASVITSVLFGNSVLGVNDNLVLNYIGNGRVGTNMRNYGLNSSIVAPGSAVIQLANLNNFADTSSIFIGFSVIKSTIT